MKDYLDTFFSRIIGERVVKEWTPTIHAPTDVAEEYPVIAGITVTVDKYCDPRSMEMRAETGKLMASINGVRPPA